MATIAGWLAGDLRMMITHTILPITLQHKSRSVINILPWMKYYASLIIQGYGLLKKIIIKAHSLFMICPTEMRLPYSGKVWQIDSFQAFGKL